MGFLRSGGLGYKPNYTGVQIQTSINTLPIPVGWGRFRIAPNLLWYNNFQRHNGKSAGKGGLFGQSGSYTYTADVILGICEGPIIGIDAIWQNTTVYNQLSDLGLTLFYGTTPQAYWGYLLSNYPAQALTYGGTAFVCAPSYSLGSSAQLPSHNFEVLTALAGGGVNGIDADPAQVIDDALFNQQYGWRYPAGSVNINTLYSSAAATTTGDAALQTYCKAVGIAFSPCLTSVETAQSVLQRWLKLLNCAVVDSGGVLQFIPFGDQSVTGNGVTFLPNLTPVFNLGDGDFLGDSSADPVQGQITDVTEAYNVERLTINDRTNAYNAVPYEARDEAAINNQGGVRVDTSVSASEICDPNVAAIVAQLILQRQLYVRNTHVIKLDARYCGLDPMDLVTLTDANMGLSDTLVRIMDIEEDDDCTLNVTVEEMPAGVGTAALYSKQQNGSGGNIQFATASPVNPPCIFEPPPSLTGNVAQVWIGASGSIGGVADPNWGGANVYVSADNTTFEYIGQINTPARQGALLYALENYAGANPEPTAYTYWRFVCSENTNGNGNTDLADIYFYNPAGTRVYPSGGTASGTTTGGSAANAFDNNLATVWEDYVGYSGGTGYVQYQFPSAQAFGSFTFFCRGDTAGGPSQITVQCSNDGVNWVTLSTFYATSWTAGVGQSLTTGAGNLQVDLTMSGGALSSAASAATAANGSTMCVVDGEVMSYTTATLTGTEQYSLTGLYRGQDGTTVQSHAQGAAFCRLDNALLVYDLPEEYIGETIYVKLASFNSTGGGLQSLANCTAYTYTPTGAGLFGPIAQALALGQNVDYGQVTGSVVLADVFGSVTDPNNLPIDLGVA